MRIFRVTAILLVGSCLGAAGNLAHGQANLLENGDFEADPEGTTLTVAGSGDNSTISGWRVFAVNGATGSATVTAAAGQTGMGLELARLDAPFSDSALDKDDSAVWETIPAQARIYQLTLDARDGGVHGATSRLFVELQFPGAQGRGANYDPSAQFETFGLTARSGTQGLLSTRLNLPSEGNNSVHLDNVRVVDATVGVNRIVNGGFENSDSRLLNWRPFGSSSFGSTTLSSDAHTGDSAALLSVTTEPTSDIGLDMDSLRIATIPGETLTLSFAAKTADAGNIFSRLKVSMAGFNAGGGWTGDFFQEAVAPPTESYETFSFEFEVPADTSFLNVAFRSVDAFSEANTTGAYLIDDVSVSRVLDISGVDLDEDGDVDGNDFLLIQRNVETASTGGDIAAWKDAFGYGAGQAVAAGGAAQAAVPEPAGLTLAACGLLVASRVRQRFFT